MLLGAMDMDGLILQVLQAGYGGMGKLGKACTSFLILEFFVLKILRFFLEITSRSSFTAGLVLSCSSVVDTLFSSLLIFPFGSRSFRGVVLPWLRLGLDLFIFFYLRSTVVLFTDRVLPLIAILRPFYSSVDIFLLRGWYT